MCAVGLVYNDHCVSMFTLKRGSESKSPAACETFFAMDGYCDKGPRLKEKLH